MRITGVSWQGFALPFINPYVAADASATLRYGLLLFLRTEDGTVGFGEASPIGVGSREAVGKTASDLAQMAPALLFLSPGELASGKVTIAWSLSPALRFGLETALLDVLGKAQGNPVSAMLGGAPGPLPVNALIASESPKEAAAEATKAAIQGFTSLKLKVAQGSLEQDEALVAAVRKVVGTGVKLRIDPNQSWGVPQAIEAISRLARYDLEYVEQPMPAADLPGMAEVRRNVPALIAADEALASTADARRIIEAGAADIFIVKAARLGGLQEALEVARVAEAAGMPVVVTSSLESGVGLAASVHLAAALKRHRFAHGLGTGLLFRDDLLSKPLLPISGALDVPKGTGLGVELDRGQLEQYAIDISGAIGDWP